MTKNKKLITLGMILIATLSLSACGNESKANIHHSQSKVKENNSQKPNQHLTTTVDYHKPSQKKPYPKLNQKQNRIVISLKKQRAFIQRKIRHTWITVYTMYVSTGSYGRTPRGYFHINGVKTKWFYDAKEHEGAQYASGWNKNGVYLFHATPANQHHQVYQKIAKQLGKKPTSYGCIHLTIPDAKYIYEKAPTGMRVIVK